MVTTIETRTVTFWLFDGFELLDVFGPVSLFVRVPGWTVELAGPAAGELVTSAHGVDVVTPISHDDLATRPGGADILIVPGGIGRIDIVADAAILGTLKRAAEVATTLAAVCTGSGILAATGCIDGYRATSNKLAWEWARAQSDRVEWVPKARWVEDGTLWTASGVAAGMDMAHALIARTVSMEVADDIANRIELEPHRDSNWDPFARVHGVV